MDSPTANLQNAQPKDKSLTKKRFQQLKQNQFQLKQRVKTLKNYDTWRKTKLLRISGQQMKKIQEEPLLSIAFNCGFKNDVNEVLEDMLHHPNPRSTTQQLTNTHKFADQFEKNSNRYKKRLSFVQYKNTKQQLHKISRNISPNSMKKRARTEELSNTPKRTLDLDKTPREIKNLRNAMKTLPILSQKEREQRNWTKYTKNFNQEKFNITNGFTKDESETDKYKDKVSLQNRKKANPRTMFFKQKISEILSTADLLLQQQVQNMVKEEANSQGKAKSAEKKFPTTHYWPDYNHYSISTNDKAKINILKSNYKDVYEEGFEFQDYILEIVRSLKRDFLQIEEKDKRGMIQALKNAFQLRFNYKISIERENYRRNVKSYLKCIQEHRNQTKREEVKANGIRRFKRHSLMQKIKMLVPQKHQDQQN